MNHPELLQGAKQQNAQALATLINQSLQGKGIKVIESLLTDGCLQFKMQ